MPAMRTRSALKRFGVAIDAPLLVELDELAAQRQCTRSELFRDLARAEVGRAKVARGVDAVAALTIVYDHHVRDLSDRLTEIQHEMGEGVRAAMHVHLSHDHCLEVIVLRGRSDVLQDAANRISGMRGVKHGAIEIVSGVWDGEGHGHAHGPGVPPHHHHHRVSAVGSAPASASAPERAGRRAKPAKSESAKSPAARTRRGRTRSG